MDIDRQLLDIATRVSRTVFHGQGTHVDRLYRRFRQVVYELGCGSSALVAIVLAHIRYPNT